MMDYVGIGCAYVRAHPESPMGDPNTAYAMGWELLCFTTDGYPVYRRMNWFQRLCRIAIREDETDSMGWTHAWRNMDKNKEKFAVMQKWHKERIADKQCAI